MHVLLNDHFYKNYANPFAHNFYLASFLALSNKEKPNASPIKNKLIKFILFVLFLLFVNDAVVPMFNVKQC